MCSRVLFCDLFKMPFRFPSNNLSHFSPISWFCEFHTPSNGLHVSNKQFMPANILRAPDNFSDLSYKVSHRGLKTTHRFFNQSKPRLCAPSARNLLEFYNIEHSAVFRSGPHDSLLKCDVLNYIQQHALKPQLAPSDEKPKPPVLPSKHLSYIDIPLTHDQQSKAYASHWKTDVPHAYMCIDCDIENILKWIKQLKAENSNVSINDIVIKCVAIGLSKYPNMNVVMANNQAKVLQPVNVTCPITTDHGIVSLVIKNVDSLGIKQMSEQINILTDRACKSLLENQELGICSFSVVNLNMFEIDEYISMINPMQSATLAFGGSRLHVINGNHVTKMKIYLSYNCSVIDSYLAGQFLDYFRKCIEHPLKSLA